MKAVRRKVRIGDGKMIKEEGGKRNEESGRKVRGEENKRKRKRGKKVRKERIEEKIKEEKVRRAKVIRKGGSKRVIIKIRRRFIPDAMDLKLLNSTHLVIQDS